MLWFRLWASRVSPLPKRQLLKGRVPNLGAELATIESATLGELLKPTNQNSNNLYAEVLLKTLGVTQAKAPISDASIAGGEAIAAALAELGVDPATVRLADGSGLSRHNLVTPSALVNTLQAMAVHPESDIFLKFPGRCRS